MDATAAPANITPAPQVVKRDGQTWGYISGNSASPLTCSGDLTAKNVGNNIRVCCNPTTCINAWHWCNDYLGTKCSDDAICSTVYASVALCNATAPGCMTYVIFNDLQTATEGLFTSYACGENQAYFKALSTTLKGAAPGSTVTVAKSSGTAEGGTSPTGGSGHLSGGAIAGIVIGSIVGALLLLGLCLYLRKKPWVRQERVHRGPGSFARTDASVDRPRRSYWFRRTRRESFQMG